MNKFTGGLAAVWVGACFLHAILMPLGIDVSMAAPEATTVTPTDTGGDE